MARVWESDFARMSVALLQARRTHTHTRHAREKKAKSKKEAFCLC